MSRDAKGGNDLSSIKQLRNEADLVEDERENVKNFLRYLQRQADSVQDEKLLRSVRQDINDFKHLKECYQQ